MINNLYKLLIEAFIVGIALIIIGAPVSMFFINKTCLLDNKFKYTLTLFLIGFLAHFIFELLKFNKLYCTYGYACNI